MRNLTKVWLLTAVALVAGAFMAASASADIIDTANSNAVYNGTVSGDNVGTPTLTSGDVVVSCDTATVDSEGGIDGDWDGSGPANASLDFGWGGCSAVSSTGGNSCTVTGVDGVSVIFDETILSAPDATIINTERGETTITCLGVFVCDAWSDPADGTEVEADVIADFNGSEDYTFINDVVGIDGVLCPDDEGTWDAVYTITPDSLEATGSQ